MRPLKYNPQTRQDRSPACRARSKPAAAPSHAWNTEQPHGIVLACAGASEGPISEEGVVDIIYHWSSPHNLLFLGPGFHLWTSNDFGDTFTELDTPGRTLGESEFEGV